MGRIPLHIIFFEAFECELENRHDRGFAGKRLSSFASMLFHRSRDTSGNNLKRVHQLSQSTRHELLPKDIILSRRPSENIPSRLNHKNSISSLFLHDMKTAPTNAVLERSAFCLSWPCSRQFSIH